MQKIRRSPLLSSGKVSLFFIRPRLGGLTAALKSTAEKLQTWNMTRDRWGEHWCRRAADIKGERRLNDARLTSELTPLSNCTLYIHFIQRQNPCSECLLYSLCIPQWWFSLPSLLSAEISSWIEPQIPDIMYTDSINNGYTEKKRIHDLQNLIMQWDRRNQ